MHVFVIGATGTIGIAVTKELMARGHEVSGLCRSQFSTDRIRDLGANAVPGDLRRPDGWADQAVASDCMIQLAATFDDNMGRVDRNALLALEAAADRAGKCIRLIYTGGCWLYGATGDQVAEESAPYDPIEPFSWMVENASFLEHSPRFTSTVLHPAMVYHREGGAFGRYLEQAKAGGPIEIWGSAQTRWPLVHRDDLAVAYRVMVEHPELVGPFNVSAEVGRSTGELAASISELYSGADLSVVDAETVIANHGLWAEGPMLDQQMSSRKLIATGLWKPEVTDFFASDVFLDLNRKRGNALGETTAWQHQGSER